MTTEDHRLVWQGIHFRAYQYETVVKSGELETHEYVYRKDGTRTLAIDADENVLLTYEYRYELDEYDWRVPGGRLNDENEPVVEAAKREFREETGYVADDWELLWTTTLESTVRYRRHFLLARRLTLKETKRDKGESITVHWVPLQEAFEMAMKSEIKEEISALAIARVVYEVNRGVRSLR